MQSQYAMITENICSRCALKKRDWIVGGLLIVLAVAGILIYCLHPVEGTGSFAAIYQDGVLIEKLDMGDEQSTRILYNDGYNVIEITDGNVSVSEASCPDELCMKQGTISQIGAQIVCLPNRLVVRIESEQETPSVDGIVQ
jgi:hypothetical protein